MKQFSSFSQQLDHLQYVKGLDVNDRTSAEAALRRIGYFGLIGGYKVAFKDPVTHDYRSGTKFEDITALYDFDENLRELLLRYLLRVERNIRALLSYYFTEKHGADQSYYLNRANYTSDQKHAGSLTKLLKTLNGLTEHNTDYPYLSHFRKRHKNIPLWVLVNALTFGSLSKMYFLSLPDIQVKVAKNFAGINRRQLAQMLNVLTKFRNVCSHNERLISYQTLNDIPDMPLHAKMKLSKKGTQYVCGKRDLFAVLISLHYLLPNEDFKVFKRSLVRIINNYLKSSTAITEVGINAMLGFPSNWKSITHYSK